MGNDKISFLRLTYMTASLLDGKSIAHQIQQNVALKIKNHLNLGKRPPALAVVLASNDPASFIYVQNKRQASAAVNIQSHFYHLAEDISEQTLIEIISKLNNDPLIDGILMQLPLPKHINTQLIIELINPDKDVDGFHPYNLGKLLLNKPNLRPCTPYGIMQLLQAYNISVVGKNAVVIGASNIVGKPMALELLAAGATVTVCHKKTQHLECHVRAAEILIVATGDRNCVSCDWLHAKHIILDVGIHRLPNKTICGDINFKEARQKVAWISPVPGGIGPMTVATLLQNTMQAYESSLRS